MPLTSLCPSCGDEVSMRAFTCLSCGQTLNEVALSITLDLIESLRDEDLLDAFYQYVNAEKDLRGCYFVDGPSDRSVLVEMPPGLRAGWILLVLVSEVLNGGFYQWFNNSSGQTTDMALDALRLIGSQTFSDLVSEAISLNERVEAAHPCYARRFEASEALRQRWTEFWADLETNYEPEFDRLTTEFYRLLEVDHCYIPFVNYVRRCPEQCVHDRSGATPQGS